MLAIKCKIKFYCNKKTESRFHSTTKNLCFVGKQIEACNAVMITILFECHNNRYRMYRKRCVLLRANLFDLVRIVCVEELDFLFEVFFDCLANVHRFIGIHEIYSDAVLTESASSSYPM